MKVVRINATIKDSRLDYTHKLTTHLIRENQTIVVKVPISNARESRAIS
ncbi:MAG: hypothetical protein QNJ74_10205 [Trichodesmium sp. MO_231.B1]|nr:hypothetical protein [Trichodesmium sp. MO_231.B1]